MDDHENRNGIQEQHAARAMDTFNTVTRCAESCRKKRFGNVSTTTAERWKRIASARDLADEHEHVVPALERRLVYLALRVTPPEGDRPMNANKQAD